MIGKNNGVAAQLKELNPIIINVHCICHNTDTNKEIAYIKRVEDTLRQLWRYFENSPKRLEDANKHQEMQFKTKTEEWTDPCKENEEGLFHKVAVLQLMACS